MSDLQFINIPVSNIHGGETSVENHDTAVAARELLKNGILVETNKGLVCMSLTDALNHGVGGHSLSEEDFQNVAAKLLFQEEPSEMVLPDTVTVVSESDTSAKPKRINKQLKRTVLRNKCNASKMSLVSLDNGQFNLGIDALSYPPVVKVISDTSKLSSSVFQDNFKSLSALAPKPVAYSSEKPMANKKSIIYKKNDFKPVIRRGEVESVGSMNYTTNRLGSVLIDSNILGDLNIKIEGSASGEDLETSDNSEVMHALPSAVEEKPKKRGGWPKGRKRKPEVRSEIRPPKAPATGYVIFLNEKRKDYKDMPFTEVTKLLGNEWSRLSLAEKKRYLDQAEVEKKRYREELKSYRQSDAYQIYLNKKRLKRLQGHGTEESDMDATDDIDDEDNEELYCRSCDQWFHSLHNKKEHLYGRQHLQSLAGRFKPSDVDWSSANMSSTSLDESSMDGSSCVNSTQPAGTKADCGDSLIMDDSIVRFMVVNREREDERKILRKKLEESRSKNSALTRELEHLNRCMESLRYVSANDKKTRSHLEQLLFNLLNVPTLFCLPESLSDGQ